MKHALAAALLMGAGSAVVAQEPTLLIPAPDGATRVRLEVTATGQAPDAAWVAFLDKLFDHFDRDSDGSLVPAEATRVFPLPLPDGRDAAMDFTALDADKDGKGSPAEFRAFYRSRGFTPVVVVVQAAPDETLALGESLFRHLDRDGNSAITAAEWKQAPGLLRRLDEDEDEVLTAAEVLALRRGEAKPSGLKLAADDDKAPPHGTLRFALGDNRVSLSAGGGRMQLSPDGSSLALLQGRCSIHVAADDPAAGFRAAREFYLAQFQDAAGDKPATKKMFEDDAAAQVLSDVFDAADRDGDGKLTRAELVAFFDLIERGIGCRVVVTATDRGRNLFDVFDTNSDGRLDLGELNQATREKPMTRAEVPVSYQLAFGRGPVGDAFGPVPFGSAAKPKAATPPVAARGPRWFLAMDKNGDGFVSPHEFVGSPDHFRKFDSDSDGRISVTEAEAAGR